MIGRALLRVLRAVTPRDLGDEIAGDLLEQAAARRRRSGRVSASLWLIATAFTTTLALVAARSPVAREDSFVSPPLPARRRGAPMSSTDVRLAFRLMFKQPVLSGTAVAAMAVAMCLAITGYTVMNAVMGAELPVPDGDRYVFMRVTDPETLRQLDVPYDVYEAWRSRGDSLREVGGFHWEQGNLELADAPPVPLRLVYLTPSGMRMTQVEPLLGRVFAESDTGPGAAPVAVVREDVWRHQLGADPDVVGGPIRISGQTYTLIGVMPVSFSFPETQNAWLPLDAAAEGDLDAAGHLHTGVEGFGILADGVDTDSAQAELAGLMAATLPDDHEGLRLEVMPYSEGMAGENFEAVMLGALGALLALLAVAAANVANLVLVRTNARRAELAVRTALGASRIGIVGQVFGEVLVLGLVAAGLATAATAGITRVLNTLIEGVAPMWITFTLEPRVVAFAVFLAIFATAIASIAPAIRSTAGPLEVALRNSTAAVAAPRLGRTSRALIVAEVAVSVALLSIAALLGRGLIGHQTTDLGLPEDEILTASLYLPPSDDRELPEFIGKSLVNELEGSPRILRAGLTIDLPKEDAERREILIQGSDADHEVTTRVARVGVGFFGGLGVEATNGRLFEPGDHVSGGSAIVVVNESFVREHFPDGRAVGRRVAYAPDSREDPVSWREIVGVVKDLGLSPAVPSEGAGMYVPVVDTNRYALALRFQGPIGDAATEMRRIVGQHDPRIIVREIQTLEQVGWAQRTVMQAVGLTLAVLGLMAMALSAAGTYAIVAFSVQQRTREIGVRVALGARPQRLRQAILGSSLGQLAVGALLGGGLATGLSRGLALLPIDVPEISALEIGLVTALMLATGVVATWSPANRAAKIDPMEALRSD